VSDNSNESDPGTQQTLDGDELDEDEEQTVTLEDGAEKGNLDTISGENYFVVVSALQKAVRREHEMLTAWCTWELARSGHGEKLWERLKVISVEDIRSDSCAPLLVHRYHDLAKELNDELSEWGAVRCAISAGLALCRARKSHEADYTQGAFNKLSDRRREAYENDETPPEYPVEIPDVALDNHTWAGKSKGRGKEFFHVHSGRLTEESEIGEECHRLALEHRDDFELGDEKFEQAIYERVGPGDLDIHVPEGGEQREL